MNSKAIWMGPWVIRLAYGLRAHGKQALMCTQAHGRPPLFNEGHVGLFDRQGTDIYVIHQILVIVYML